MEDLTQFIDAVTRGDLSMVVAMLATDPAVARAADRDGATPLHHAAFAGEHEIVDVLLRAGADLNALDGKFGATPGGWALHRLRERGALLAVEIDDVLFALERGDGAWARRLVTRHAALKTARDRHGRPLAAHPRVLSSPDFRELFESNRSLDEG
jgi:hypothetical protein